MHKLRNDCPQCTWQEWNQFDECAYSSELSEAFWIYSKRMQYLRSKEVKRQFELAHGRPHKDILELAIWQDEHESDLPQ
jgi:hypothetical protein